MFSHIQVGAKDLDLMVSFYDAALGHSVFIDATHRRLLAPPA